MITDVSHQHLFHLHFYDDVVILRMLYKWNLTFWDWLFPPPTSPETHLASPSWRAGSFIAELGLEAWTHHRALSWRSSWWFLDWGYLAEKVFISLDKYTAAIHLALKETPDLSPERLDHLPFSSGMQATIFFEWFSFGYTFSSNFWDFSGLYVRLLVTAPRALEAVLSGLFPLWGADWVISILFSQSLVLSPPLYSWGFFFFFFCGGMGFEIRALCLLVLEPLFALFILEIGSHFFPRPACTTILLF
jgi:hypothetical protein